MKYELRHDDARYAGNHGSGNLRFAMLWKGSSNDKALLADRQEKRVGIVRQ